MDTVWKDLVQRAPAKHVAMVAHSYGGVATLELVSCELEMKHPFETYSKHRFH